MIDMKRDGRTDGLIISLLRKYTEFPRSKMEGERNDFLFHWPQLINFDPLIKEDLIDEPCFVEFMSKFSKLLSWRQQHIGDYLDKTVVSHMLCYTDQLLSIFNSANVCVQLQAAKLLLVDKFQVLRRVLNLSLEKLDTREMSGM